MERHTSLYSNAIPHFKARFVRSVMHDPSLGRQQILRPYLLNMDQSTLPLAEKEMLQRRELYKIVFSVQLQFFLHGHA
jgi:type IV secretory pathway TrbF-like protein